MEQRNKSWSRERIQTWLAVHCWQCRENCKTPCKREAALRAVRDCNPNPIVMVLVRGWVPSFLSAAIREGAVCKDKEAEHTLEGCGTWLSCRASFQHAVYVWGTLNWEAAKYRGYNLATATSLNATFSMQAGTNQNQAELAKSWHIPVSPSHARQWPVANFLQASIKHQLCFIHFALPAET